MIPDKRSGSIILNPNLAENIFQFLINTPLSNLKSKSFIGAYVFCTKRTISK